MAFGGRVHKLIRGVHLLVELGLLRVVEGVVVVVPLTQGRVFAMTQQDAQATPNVVTGTLTIFN